ncbi:MAG: tyrosine-type recombinase/integrase [Streptosporangiales bacterium]|nr:tyrosine-type recombinase/integrase [Streptosporangiales bacterium]
MANKEGHRKFGNIRQLPSGRHQANYLGPDGLRRNADHTFESEKEAADWLTLKEAELLRGDWIDPNRARVKLADYAERWVRERALGERTREGYESLLRLHILPFVGEKELRQVTPEVVRSWRARLLAEGRSETRAAKAYRLLRAVFNTAVDDERVKKNPCRIKGADKERTEERPVASIPQVLALAALVSERFQALILAAAFTGLRWGELVGLRRRDVDLVEGVVYVRRSLRQLDSGQLREGRTKSAAGVRPVSMPEALVDVLDVHLRKHVGEEADALVFTGAKGAGLKRGNWRKTVRWTERIAAVGLPEEFHFHDLRHTGNQLAARSGASTRELMRRMGHSTVRAALIYQHATDDRDQEIAKALNTLIEAEKIAGRDADRTDDDGA